MKRQLFRTFAAFTALVAVLSTAPIPNVNAYQDNVNLANIVSQTPSSNTPIVPGVWQTEDYEVNAFAAHNGVMYAGGRFPTVLSPNGATSYPRQNIFAFNPNTGAVSTSFAPQFNGQVESILAYNGALYVGGLFTSMNGQAVSRVVKLNPSNGARDTTFNPVINGKVSDMDIAYGSLVISGKFTTVNGSARSGIANLNLTTGAPRTEINLALTGTITSTLTDGSTVTCETGGYRMAIDPAGTKMVLAGCFTLVSGWARQQFVLVTLGATSATVNGNWRAPITLNNMCNGTRNPAAIEDLDFYPSGRYFFGVAGGGDRGKLCDAVFRFDTNKTGTDVAPDFVIPAKDTLRGVEATTAATYLSGHNHELVYNGISYARDGIAAVTSGGVVGVLSWNPGKGRAVGSRELYATNSATHPGFPTGLWVGSDSGECGKNVGVVRNNDGICFFPMP